MVGPFGDGFELLGDLDDDDGGGAAVGDVDEGLVELACDLEGAGGRRGKGGRVGKGRAVDGGGERHGLEAGEHTHAVGYAGIVRMQPIGRR